MFQLRNNCTAGEIDRYQEGNKGVHFESLRTEGSEPVEDFHFSLMRFDMGLEFRYDRYNQVGYNF